MTFFTLKTFDNSINAHILKAALEAEGIECFIIDENIVTLNPLYNFAVGGIKLKVLEGDKEKAIGVLIKIENTPYLDEKEQVIKCPSCNSTELYTDFKSMKGAKGILSVITSFLFTIFPIYFNSVYKCKKCNKEFK